jgi:phenylpyruvate tautomerase PptA (4-oxalocrotonate tautomerase family)
MLSFLHRSWLLGCHIINLYNIDNLSGKDIQMPQVIIHMPSVIEEGPKAALLKKVRETLTTVLELDDVIGQVILYESPKIHRCASAERDPNFVFVETFMHPGREQRLKSKLMERIIHLINQYTDVDPKNILGVIHEIPRESYYGGLMRRH